MQSFTNRMPVLMCIRRNTLGFTISAFTTTPEVEGRHSLLYQHSDSQYPSNQANVVLKLQRFKYNTKL